MNAVLRPDGVPPFVAGERNSPCGDRKYNSRRRRNSFICSTSLAEGPSLCGATPSFSSSSASLARNNPNALTTPQDTQMFHQQHAPNRTGVARPPPNGASAMSFNPITGLLCRFQKESLQVSFKQCEPRSRHSPCFRVVFPLFVVDFLCCYAFVPSNRRNSLSVEVAPSETKPNVCEGFPLSMFSHYPTVSSHCRDVFLQEFTVSVELGQELWTIRHTASEFYGLQAAVSALLSVCVHSRVVSSSVVSFSSCSSVI